MHTHN